jgi:hypothetical protein
MKEVKGMKEMKKSADLAAACGGQRSVRDSDRQDRRVL